MKRTPFNAWLAYAGVGFAVTAVVAALAANVAAAPDRGGIWLGAGIAYALQLVAFAFLLAMRDYQFMAGLVGGMVLRFAAVVVCALWLSRSQALPPAATLFSLVGFAFMLLLLESVFLRWARQVTKR